MWHSLDEYGNIEVYDVLWKSGIETDIPVHMLEGVKEGSHHNEEKHGVQKKSTPKNERRYKKKQYTRANLILVWYNKNKKENYAHKIWLRVP